uniref:Uncharacterized protein n=1 Tax=Timema bartmani TaxID=61472 RepID=A0A7R9HYC2_9NEOP|nr:unnamed protein product [Timema bartmani]
MDAMIVTCDITQINVDPLSTPRLPTTTKPGGDAESFQVRAGDLNLILGQRQERNRLSTLRGLRCAPFASLSPSTLGFASMIKMMVIVVIVFTMCWLPFNSLLLISMSSFTKLQPPPHLTTLSGPPRIGRPAALPATSENASDNWVSAHLTAATTGIASGVQVTDVAGRFLGR